MDLSSTAMRRDPGQVQIPSKYVLAIAKIRRADDSATEVDTNNDGVEG